MTKNFKLKPVREPMGIIISSVTVTNAKEPKNSISFEGLVDTGSTFLTLPSAWKKKLGKLEKVDEVKLELANGEIRTGEVFGPAEIKVGNFRPVFSEVLFIDMETDEKDEYEPLIGYLILEAIPVAVDMLGHRLIKVKANLK